MKSMGYSVIAFTCFVTGCSSFSPPAPSGHFETAKSARHTADKLLSQAQACWASEVNPVKRGLIVDGRKDQGNVYLINVFSQHWTQGIEKEPFLVIRIDGNNPMTAVDVIEGDVGCAIFKGCYKLGLTKQVKSWLDGESQCQDFDHSLVHM